MDDAALRAHDQFIQKRLQYIHIDSNYPMGELLSLFKYGRQVGRHQQGSSAIFWDETYEELTLSKGNKRFTMTQFRSFACQVLQSAITALDGLLISMPYNMDMKCLRDHPNNTETGFSFTSMHDQARLSQKFLNHLATVQDQHVYSPFKYPATSRWRSARVRDYLDQITTALQLTLLAIYI